VCNNSPAECVSSENGLQCSCVQNGLTLLSVVGGYSGEVDAGPRGLVDSREVQILVVVVVTGVLNSSTDKARFLREQCRYAGEAVVSEALYGWAIQRAVDIPLWRALAATRQARLTV